MITETDLNVWKAKAISRGKLLERFRDLIMNMADHVQNEGDRVYFGSTNDYDELRAIGQEMDMWKWDRIIRERPERDPYADCRKLREAIYLTNAAFEGLFAQCLSNGVFDAWGKPVDCTNLNKAMAAVDRIVEEDKASFRSSAAAAEGSKV